VARPTKEEVARRGYRASKDEKSALDLWRRCYNLAEPQHKKNVAYYRERWADYQAVIEWPADFPKWKSKLHPPYLMRAAETLYAQLAQLNPELAIEPLREADVDIAERVELLVTEQMQADGSAWKEQLLLKTGIILGIAAEKVSWAVEQITYEKMVDVPLTDDAGEPITDPETGEPRLTQESQECTETIKNQPTSTVCDMHDLMWDPYARHPDEISFVLWRTHSTPEAIKAKGRLKDREGNPIYRNTEHVPTADSVQQKQTSEARTTENTRRDTKGRVAVWELHIRDDQGVRLITCAGDGEVLLRDVRNVYRHGHLPFNFFVTMPDLYGLRGISELWAARDLQSLKWTQMNQRVDNAELINNTVIFYRRGALKADELVIFPGAAIGVDNPDEVTFLYPRSNLIEPMEASERNTLHEIDDIMGSGALVSGNDPSLDPRTAAESMGIRNAAQKRMAAKQNLYLDSRRRKGFMWIELNRQLLDEPVSVKQVGSGPGGWDFHTLYPSEMEQAQLRFNVRSADEQLLDEERRTKAMQLYNTVIASAPNLMQLAQATGQMFLPNPKEILLELFRAFGVTEAKRLVTAMMPPPPPQLGLPPAGPPLAGGGTPAGNGAPPGPPNAPLPDLNGAPQVG
jgi:hypothetical protein